MNETENKHLIRWEIAENVHNYGNMASIGENAPLISKEEVDEKLKKIS